MIGEKIVGVSLEWSVEVMFDGHGWVSLGFVGCGWVMSGVVDCCWVMCGVGAGEIVRFTLNGKTYDIATNASGIAVRTIALVPGQYGVYAVYEGYKTVQSVFKVYKTLSVSSGTVKKTASSFTFKAVLKSSVGVSVAGKTVTFKFNGKKYAVRTNVNGVAQYTIKSGVIKKLKKGTYQVFAMYVNEVAKANIRVK